MTKAIFDGVTYNVRQGTNGKNTLIEGLGNDWIKGGGGDDTIIDLLGNNLFDGGSGSDTIIGGIGNDIFIHRMSENTGAKDRYEGALGTDMLHLELTAAEWARADVQADIAAFLAHTAKAKNKLLSLAGLTSEFTFKSMGLTISNIEKLEVRVDGVAMNLADEAVVARPDTLRTHEDAGAVSINLLANDSAPDRVASIQLLTQSQFGAVTLTPSLLASTQTAVLAFTPGAAMQALKVGETRTETLTYRITDVDGDVSTSTVTIIIEGRNDAAVIGTPSVAFVQEDVGVSGGKLKASGTISISDADQGQASFKTAVVAQPGALGTLTLAANGTYTYAVDNAAVQYLGDGQSRVDSFRIESIDGTQKVVSFTIKGKNDGPTAAADIAGPLVEAGTVPGLPTATGNVLTNDTDVDAGDTKTVSAVNGDAAKVGAIVAGTYGRLVLQTDGSWTYTLDDTAAGTDRLAEGQTATELFSYTMRDSRNATSSTTLAITIRGANDAPVVSGTVTGAATEGGASLALDLLQHASDVDSGAVLHVENLVLSGSDGPAVPVGFTWSGATLSVDPSHPVFDALAVGQQRVLTFSYDVVDEHGARTAQTAAVTITGTNDVPVVSAVGVSVAENAVGALVATFAVADVDTVSGLSFRVLDGAAVDPRFVVVPAAGTAEGEPGSYEIRLAAGQSFDFEAENADGNPSLVRTIEVNDGQAANNLASSSFTIVVTDVPEAPTATGDHGTTLEGQTVAFTVAQLVGNDANPSGAQPLAITGVSGAVNGTVSFAGGIVTFTPAAHFSGVARFDYMLDNGAGTDTGTVTIDVAPVADMPVLVAGGILPADLVPLGGDVVVNTTTTGSQQYGSVAAIDGGYVVTWSSYGQDGSGAGIYQQRYDANGNPQGGEARVNTYTTSDQVHSSVAAIEGGYVVTWSSHGQDGGGYGIYQQRYDANGNPQGGEARVNTFTAGSQLYSSVAAIEGGYVVTWSSYGQDGGGYGIYQQRYDANGNPQGGEARVSTHATGDQYTSSVAAIEGGYVVTWTSAGQDGSGMGIYQQRYDTNGVPQGGEARVNTHTAGDQLYPSVVAIEDGYVVMWSSLDQDGSGWGIYQQRYDMNGDPQGGETRVNTYTASHQVHPSVAAIDGGYVVTWTSYGQDGSGTGIYGQRFAADGSPAGTEFRVNADVAGDQFAETYYTGRRAIAVTADGQLIAVWDQDWGLGGIEHRRFKLLAATQGEEDTAIAVPLRVTLGDLDGSESLTGLVLEGVPAGATISDGAHSLVSTGDGLSILGWDLANLTFQGAANAHGTYALTLSAEVTDTATRSEGASATDSATFTKTFDVLVKPVNDAPVFQAASHAFALAENNAAGATVGAVLASDVDAGDTVRYAITGGNTNNWFAIDELTGRITTSHAFDFETDPKAFDLTVQARDRVTGGLTDTTNVAVAITDLPEKRVGYYTTGSSLVDAGFAADIARSGNIPVKLTSLNALGTIDVLIIDGLNWSGNPASAFVANKDYILNRVVTGQLDLFINDVSGDWASYVPGFGAVQSTGFSYYDVNVPGGSPFASGVGGVLTDASLDGSSGSANGAMLRASLPPDVQVILTNTSPNAVTGIAREWGSGTIVYTTLSVSYYYHFAANSGDKVAAGMSNWVANVVEELAGTTNQGPGFTIAGTAKRDELFGGAGDDRITGAGAPDTLKGGAGADRFVFNAPNEGLDVVLDFSRLEGDKLEIGSAGFGLSPNAAAHVQEVAALGEATGTQATFVFVTGGADAGTVYFDADGTGADPAKAFVKLAGVTSLSANDILIV